MHGVRLTQRRVGRLNPCRNKYALRDTELRGFGVAVLNTGVRRFYIQNQYQMVRRCTRSAMPGK